MTGRTVGHYQILDKLGQGGMGVVWKARDTQLDRFVALKFLHSSEDVPRLLREAKTVALLNHPNICTVHEVDPEGGFLVMEFVEGQSLSDRIGGRPLPVGEAIGLALQICEGLRAAHDKGVVHRDIKSGNVLVTAGGHAKIMDFGLARVAGQAGLTKEGAVAGTPGYMAPEQARGEPVDRRTDIWAVGAVLHEMLTGRPPMGQAETLPEGVGRIVRKALAADPRERYQHVEDMLVDLRRTAGTPAVKPSRRQWLRVGAATATVIIITVLAWMDAGGLRTRLLGRMGGSARAVKLAILPFANMTGDPEQEYLSDGLTQEMISQLGSLHPANLSVIARTSVMRYKKSDKPVDEVGRELGVDYILEGSARREGNRIRITAELIQVRNQTQIWTETYEREVAGILALQSEVAKKVAGSLALKLLPAEQARLANVRQVNPEAYEAYLKGMQHWNRLTPADVETALQYFDLSIKKDPNYAPAHVGVYRVWTARRQMGRIPHKEAVAPATAAALKALELDENLAVVHEALAGMKSWQEWDWAGGELEYRRAIELDPSLADARAYYSHLLLVLQRPKEAMEQMQRAIELDPLNPLVQSLYAAELWRFRRYDEALVQAHNALRTAPGQPVATTALLAALHNKGMENELVAEMRASASLSGRREAIEAFERGYKEGGYRAGWKRYAEHIAAGFGRTHWSALGAADSYAKAGKNALALDWLEKAFEAHDGNLPYVFVTPTYDQLRSEPRFQALRRKMNLPG